MRIALRTAIALVVAPLPVVAQLPESATGRSSVPASAEPKTGPHARGLWVAFGGGAGLAHTACDQCVSLGRDAGGTMEVGVGGTISPHLQVGAEVSGWFDGLGAGRSSTSFADVVGYYLPWSKSGWFVQAGGGYARYSQRTGRGGTVTTTTTRGLGAQLGAGYQFGLGRTFILSPFVAYHRAFSSGLKFEGTDVGVKVHHEVWRFGAMLRWRFAPRYP